MPSSDQRTRSAVELPSGVVTFVFTDIEGSTRLMREIGDGRYGAILERHRHLLDGAWERFGGHVVDVEGDGTLVAFEDATDAVLACAEGQRRLAAEPWPDGRRVRVRMGVHGGPASPRDGNYIALAVHQAARVIGAAHGGQVVVSDQVRHALAASDEFSLVSLGRFRVRDFDEPVTLHQLRAEGLDVAFPAARALPADGHNLVRPPTSFVGREQDVAEVVSLLRAGALLSLVGPGGVGKTRLAVEVGILVAPEWDDGVWMVDLAPIEDPALVHRAVADALGVRAGFARTDDEVVEHLAEKRSLLVLDNCEQVVAAVAALAERLLREAPGCALLVTSRERIHVPGETVWRVAPLSEPALQLYLDRARAVLPGFALDADNERTLTAICRTLDGLPLAIEMAAARMDVLSPAAVLEGLSARARVLENLERGHPTRHRTMDAVLDWSEHLLERAEREALHRLALFVDGFSIEGAEVAVADDELGLGPFDVAPLVWSLVDKSLVVSDRTANATRYRLLETVRAYARQQLDATGRTATVAARLGAWWLEQVGPGRPLGLAWQGVVAVELDNLRGLIPLLAGADVEVAQALACTIGRYHDGTQGFLDGREELLRYATLLDEAMPARIALLTTLADLHLRLGELDGADAAVDEAVRLRERLGGVPSWEDAGIDRARGDISIRRGDRREAARIARAALETDLSVRGRCRMWNLLGIATVGEDDVAAYDAFSNELVLTRELGQEVYLASAHGNLAEVALRLGDVPSAARHQCECLDLAVQLGRSVMVAYSLLVAARFAVAGERWALAVELHASAERLLEEASLALYDDDRRVSDEMLAAARAHLPGATFARAARRGRALDAAAVADTARSLFLAAVR